MTGLSLSRDCLIRPPAPRLQHGWALFPSPDDPLPGPETFKFFRVRVNLKLPRAGPGPANQDRQDAVPVAVSVVEPGRHGRFTIVLCSESCSIMIRLSEPESQTQRRPGDHRRPGGFSRGPG